jgi:hypothetical protein
MRRNDSNPQLPTTEKLAKALEQAHAPQSMITAARAGRYDDFKSAFEMPIHDLVRDCRKYGLHALAQAAIDGEFDATRDEAKAWATT